MKLILFRHGVAIDRETALQQKLEDSRRPLTEKGRERTYKMSQVLQKWEPEVDLLVTSPLDRAHQTTQILFQTLKPENVLESAELVPSAPPQAFAKWLKIHAKEATCILGVGHEPQLSVFASWVLSGLPQSMLQLKKSGMLCLEFESFDQIGVRSAQLQWLVQPKLVLK